MRSVLYAIVRVIYTPYRIVCNILSFFFTIGVFVVIFDTQTFPGDGRYLLAAAVFGILILLQLIRLLLVKLLAYLGNMDVITPL